MHELEMKALHDPFLSEALEGAAFTDPSTFSKDVDMINKKIIENRSSKLLWPLRIAASILLVVSIAYIATRFDHEQPQDQMALQQDPSTKDLSLGGNDSTTKTELNPENLLSLSSKESNDSKISERNISKSQSGQQSKDLSITKTPDNETSLPAEAETEAISDKEITEKEFAFNESRSTEDVQPLGKLDAVSSQSEVLRRATAPLPASGAGADKKSKSSPSPSEPKPDLDSGYDNYLRTNVRYPQSAIDNKVEGEVVVSFNVKADGTLTDFIVDKGIGHGCDEELIRLIKNGPSWLPSNMDGKAAQQRATVAFVFKLPK